ncbi:hypothetical protein EVAR_70821_1 [Eumeta japonica]|uniref:Uncharacterized protein n=1 Tax=Eumeta variegata TaxID=151549 RepID=A0A4C2A7V3_EUMVA|nr:hypothetical protein EVAR_70821_1 [Eumeta japonica]
MLGYDKRIGTSVSIVFLSSRYTIQQLLLFAQRQMCQDFTKARKFAAVNSEGRKFKPPMPARYDSRAADDLSCSPRHESDSLMYSNKNLSVDSTVVKIEVGTIRFESSAPDY